MYRAGERECPFCHGPAYRVRRRLLDRIASLILPQQRFRCASIGCGWEGNLPLKTSPPPRRA
jgi:hypothetical protein